MRDALVLEQRRPHFEDADPASQRRSGHHAALLHGGDVDRHLEREAGPEPIEHAGGGRVGLLGRRLGPHILGPHRREERAGRQPPCGEPLRAAEERSPVDVLAPLLAGRIEQFLPEAVHVLTLHIAAPGGTKAQ